MSKSLDARLDALEAVQDPAPMTLEEMDFLDLTFAVRHGRPPKSKDESRDVELLTDDEVAALVAKAEAEMPQ